MWLNIFKTLILNLIFKLKSRLFQTKYTKSNEQILTKSNEHILTKSNEHILTSMKSTKIENYKYMLFYVNYNANNFKIPQCIHM